MERLRHAYHIDHERATTNGRDKLELLNEIAGIGLTCIKWLSVMAIVVLALIVPGIGEMLLASVATVVLCLLVPTIIGHTNLVHAVYVVMFFTFIGIRICWLSREKPKVQEGVE